MRVPDSGSAAPLCTTSIQQRSPNGTKRYQTEPNNCTKRYQTTVPNGTTRPYQTNVYERYQTPVPKVPCTRRHHLPTGKRYRTVPDGTETVGTKRQHLRRQYSSYAVALTCDTARPSYPYSRFPRESLRCLYP